MISTVLSGSGDNTKLLSCYGRLREEGEIALDEMAETVS
jgi:hypothetical protein